MPRPVARSFERFVHQVTGGDKALAKYLQRVIGYTLTGRTNEQCLYFLHGNGANGKSTFLNVIKELLGPDLARQTPSETLMTRHNSSTNDIARLQSVRMVSANEIEDGSLLAESLVKQMTGGEAMTARYHYQEFFEFVPKFKLFIAGNHKPVIRGRDNGIWRRIRLIPFVVTIPSEQRDEHLQEKLHSELPGILNWAIKGCRIWQKNGLKDPAVITNAVTAYRDEMDLIGAWIDEHCKVGAGLECRASVVYSNYKLWAEGNGYRPMSANAFGRELSQHYPKEKRNDGNFLPGHHDEGTWCLPPLTVRLARDPGGAQPARADCCRREPSSVGLPAGPKLDGTGQARQQAAGPPKPRVSVPTSTHAHH